MLIWRIAIVALIGFVVWRMLRRDYVIRIVVDHHGVQRHEGLAKVHQSAVVEFFKNDVSLDGKVTILATRHRNGYLRVDFKGPIDPGTRQRVRNFLISLL